ncbi:MAG: TauD/TfdA dioxygenase family protein, partial [Geminicoccaceae bacterium]
PFTYSHRWQVGDVLMWDNRATLHRRDSFDADTRRYMLRTQIQGKGKPVASTD